MARLIAGRIGCQGTKFLVGAAGNLPIGKKSTCFRPMVAENIIWG
jgi:hypothetical protein